ncbi:hypothetical protein GF339_15150, partial [candidate division KSB3 bacterium]|nr:hypothetical protein [candidate division KSB3 bacterium]MBD3325922.1 hypothetical protein [candidate division KSB3 bacterium]
MKCSALSPAQLAGLRDGIVTVDSHTAGEFTRLVVGGLEDIPGDSMAVKRAYFQQHHDHLRLMLIQEPRGYGGVAAVVTPPVHPASKFGLIYMDAKRYPFLC